MQQSSLCTGYAGSVNITEIGGIEEHPASHVTLAALGEVASLTDGNGAARRKKVLTMDKPKNPYQKGTLIWSVMEGDWEDLTVTQIAEVLGTSPNNIAAYIYRIKQETGCVVPCLRGKTGRKADE